MKNQNALSLAFGEHRPRLLGLCYRLVGTRADAEECVQETFVRALQSPPKNSTASWAPWLTRVAMNIAKDRLRHRQSQAYIGPWLPEPLRTDAAPFGDNALNPEARYSLRESTTFAFLHALECLSPKARAVLILRDVYGQSVRECAAALELSESNIKVILHRARNAMAGYDEAKLGDPASRSPRTQRALGRLMVALATDDAKATAALLHEEVQMLNDGAGEFFAARKPIQGRRAVATFFRRTKPNATLRTQPVELNGLPAMLTEYVPDRSGIPPRSAFQLEVDEEGRITRIYAVVCSSKLRTHFEALRQCP